MPATYSAAVVACPDAVRARVCSAYVRRHALLPPLLGSGVLGGFTTLSTMSEESRALLDGGHAGLAATYLLVTLGACMLAVALADRFSSRRDRQEFEDEEGDL